MITKNNFQMIISFVFHSIRKLTETKGEEYSRDEDQLANFKRMAIDAEMPMEKVWLLFFSKHMDAIKSWIKTGGTKSESIESRIDDAILYLILLRAMVEDIKGGPKDVYVNKTVDEDDRIHQFDEQNNRRSGVERRTRASQGYVSSFNRRILVRRNGNRVEG